MNSEEIAAALAEFDAAIAETTDTDAVWTALQTLCRQVIGARLFTIMTVDLVNEVARRAYTSHPQEYPTSGTKPVRYNDWFDVVHKERRTFVANTIADIAKIFPDHETIRSLGCGSVANIPVAVGGKMLGTVNCLDVEQHYTPERIALSRHLELPAKLAFLAAERAARA